MRAVQKHTTQSESQPQSTPMSGPVQRHESLRSVDYDTAVQRLAPVQAKEDTGAVHAAAQRGTSGGGGSLPYLGQIQKSFGGHDVSGIKSHTGGKASEACDSMGAEAYASGQDVAFKGQPDLHTAAHEAAHIVQQRAGVQLSGGVGQAGDAYEKNADEVADRVVQGKSAEDLLGGGGYGGAGAIQRSIQMKGGFLDRLKSYFLEAKLTGPQQEVAKILAEKHGVDVSGLPNSIFTSLYNDATAGNAKMSPAKIADNMASAARDHVGEAKKPTQKKDSSPISGHTIQRKESRHVQRSNVQRGMQRGHEIGASVDLTEGKISGGYSHVLSVPSPIFPIGGPFSVQGTLSLKASAGIGNCVNRKGRQGVEVTGGVSLELSLLAGLIMPKVGGIGAGASLGATLSATAMFNQGGTVINMTGVRVGYKAGPKMNLADVLDHELVLWKGDLFELASAKLIRNGNGRWFFSYSGFKVLHQGAKQAVRTYYNPNNDDVHRGKQTITRR